MFGLHRDTERKILKYSVPPGYRRQSSPHRRRSCRTDPGYASRPLHDQDVWLSDMAMTNVIRMCGFAE